MRKTLAERYWAKVDRRGPDECWPWTGATRRECPYGQLWDGTYLPSGHVRMVIASRIGYTIQVGPIPDGLHVLHRCDNPPCQNPTHWFLGTIMDNNKDKLTKGRHKVGDNWGDNHGMHILTPDQVAEIRARYEEGGIFQKDLAREYGVRQQQISRIVRRTSWKPR